MRYLSDPSSETLRALDRWDFRLLGASWTGKLRDHGKNSKSHLGLKAEIEAKWSHQYQLNAEEGILKQKARVL